MLRPINSIPTNSNFLYQPSARVKNQTETTSQPFELSGADVGRAILASYRVSFRNNKDLPIYIETRYPYESNSIKDDYVAFIITMLLISYTPPFHSEKSTVVRKNGKHYHKLFLSTEYDKDGKLTKESLRKQNELFKALYRVNFDNTVDDTKNIQIEEIEKDYKMGKIDSKTKDEEINAIKSITVKDIRNHMNKYLINQDAQVI